MIPLRKEKPTGPLARLSLSQFTNFVTQSEAFCISSINISRSSFVVSLKLHCYFIKNPILCGLEHRLWKHQLSAILMNADVLQMDGVLCDGHAI